MKPHLAECGKLYKQVIKEQLDENIHPEPFVIIVALRMFLNIPILVIKPKTAEITRTQRRKVTHWEGTEWFCIKNDEALDKSQFHIFLVFNGIMFFAPAVYTPRVHVNRTETQFWDILDETMDLAKEITDTVPPSEFFSAYTIIMKNLDAADSISTHTHIATSTATIALHNDLLLLEFLQLKLLIIGKKSATASSPEGAAGGPEEEDDRPCKTFKSESLDLISALVECSALTEMI